MKITTLTLLTFLALGTGLAGQAATLAGTWTVSIHDDHVVPIGLVLEQDGTHITGKLRLHGRDIPVEGEYVEGKLSIATADQDTSGAAHGFGAMTITATLKADGTLEGEAVSSRGRMPLTAERLGRRG